MSRTNRTTSSKYKDPSSPKKSSEHRRGSDEKMSSAGRSGKRQLRRSSTAPSNRKGSSSQSLESLRAKRTLERRSSGSPKGGRKSSSESLSASKKKVQQKHNGANAKNRNSLKNKTNGGGGGGGGGGGEGGGGGGGGGGSNGGNTNTNSSGTGNKRERPSALKKCLRAICGGVALAGDYEVNSKMASETVAKLLLKTSDLKKLRKSFEDIDIDDSGEIDYDEFLEHMEERRNAFTDAVFRLIDENGDGVLEFDEFVSICGSFCMWNRGEILKFCFDTCKFLIFFFCPFPLF